MNQKRNDQMLPSSLNISTGTGVSADMMTGIHKHLKSEYCDKISTSCSLGSYSITPEGNVKL